MERLPDLVRPGRRVRLMLATALDEPDPNDDEWRLQMGGGYGVCDTSVYAVPAGGASEFMPAVYAPLYAASARG